MNGFLVVSPNLFVVRGMTIVRNPDGLLVLIDPVSLDAREVRELEKLGVVRWLCGRGCNEPEWCRHLSSAVKIAVNQVPGAMLVEEEGLFFPQHHRTLVAGSLVWRRGLVFCQINRSRYWLVAKPAVLTFGRPNALICTARRWQAAR